jgi:hypothetical protein
MTRWTSFAGSAGFAALAAAGWLPWLVTVGAVVGPRRALAVYLVGATAVYLAVLAPAGARRLGVALGAALVGGVLAMVARAPGELALGLGVILGVARSAFLYRARPARAVVMELALVGGGLLFARALVGPPALSVMLALWGFFLVQSCFFLVGGVGPRPADGARRDPFDEAYARAMRLMDA